MKKTACLLPGLVLAALFLARAIFPPQEGEDAVLQLSGATMGTSWSLQLPRLPAGLDRNALAADLQARLDRLDKGIFSTWDPASELSRFNAVPPGTAFPASAELREVLALALEIHGLSGGAFDPTVGPLVDLWGFGPAPARREPPQPEEIARALARVDMAALQHGPGATVVRMKDIRLDLSGIAKGYAVDRLAARLEALGIADYLLEIGGEVTMKGERAAGSPWRLALEQPRQGPRQAAAVIAAPDGESLAAAGSGDYRNWFESAGRRYSHEIDPRDGRPTRHHLAAVTVLDASAARADALATALLVLGPEAGPALARGQGVAAFFIMRGSDGFESLATGDFERYLLEPVHNL